LYQTFVFIACNYKPTYIHRQADGTPQWTVSHTPFTRYNRLSNRLYNRFDNRVDRTATVSCIQPVWPVECLYTRYNRLSNRLFDNRFDNRLYRV